MLISFFFFFRKALYFHVAPVSLPVEFSCDVTDAKQYQPVFLLDTIGAVKKGGWYTWVTAGLP